MKLKKYIGRLVIFTFLVIIFLPNIGLFQATDEEYIKENLNRMPYQFPLLTLKDPSNIDFSAIENWYGDKASFVTTLSEIWADMNYRLGISAKPNLLIGKNGWIFASNNFALWIDRYTGKKPPEQDEVMLLVNGLKRMNDVAQKHHIPFVVMIVPTAMSVYPEYAPDYIHMHDAHTSVIDQLEQLLPKESVDFINLRPVLIEAKTQGKDLYRKGDPHWNYLGAYAAYQALAKNVESRYGLHLNRYKFKFHENLINTGFYAVDLQRTDVWSDQELPDLSAVTIDMLGRDIHGVTQKMNPYQGNDNAITTIMPYENINMKSDNRDTCLLIGDSFLNNMSISFYNDFYDTVRVHPNNRNYNLSQLIERYHPKLIVFEITETALYQYYNSFSPNLEQTSIDVDVLKPVDFSAVIESLSIVDDKVQIMGWGYLPQANAATSETYLQLSDKATNYYYLLNQELRQDIKARYKNGINLGVSGFSGKISQKELPKGNYKASIIIVNDKIFGKKDFTTTYTIEYKENHKETLPNLPKSALSVLSEFPLNEVIQISSITPKIAEKIRFFPGWSSLESLGIWTNDHAAFFTISSKNVPEKFKLVLSYRGLVALMHPKQSYEFYNGQGKLLQQCDYEMNGSLEKTVTLNMIKARDVNSEGYVSIFIKVLNPVSPSAVVPASPDDRLLGMRLMRIKMLPDS